MNEIFKASLPAMKTTIESTINAGKEVPRSAFIFSDLTPMGFALPLEELSSPDAVAPALRAACEMMNAWGLVQISEAWTIERDTEEELDEESEKYAGDIEGHPDRAEAVFIAWEHRQEQGMMMALIVTKDGKRTLGEWKESQSKEDVKGRLASLLPGARG